MSGTGAEIAERGEEAAPADLHLASQICFAVYSAAHAFNRIYKPLLDSVGLTYPQYLVLLVLWEEDGQTMKAIGQRLYLDSGTLTPLMKRLEGAGLVRRARDGADERLMRITLTESGRALRQRALPFPTDILCASGRSPGRLKDLRDDIVSLRDALQAHAAPEREAE
ncbi:MarR family winged helix-turn-helix transcriptional regulator [Methylobacterium sp. JK268]